MLHNPHNQICPSSFSPPLSWNLALYCAEKTIFWIRKGNGSDWSSPRPDHNNAASGKGRAYTTIGIHFWNCISNFFCSSHFLGFRKFCSPFLSHKDTLAFADIWLFITFKQSIIILEELYRKVAILQLKKTKMFAGVQIFYFRSLY